MTSVLKTLFFFVFHVFLQLLLVFYCFFLVFRSVFKVLAWKTKKNFSFFGFWEALGGSGLYFCSSGALPTLFLFVGSSLDSTSVRRGLSRLYFCSSGAFWTLLLFVGTSVGRLWEPLGGSGSLWEPLGGSVSLWDALGGSSWPGPDSIDFLLNSY